MGLNANHRTLGKYQLHRLPLILVYVQEVWKTTYSPRRNYIVYLKNKYLKALSGAIIKYGGATHTLPQSADFEKKLIN